jgi:ferritin-like protein
MPDQEKMDVPGVVDALNDALRLQYRSALLFALTAGGGRGTHSLAVGQELARYGEEEYASIRLLVSKIVALGGEPTTDVAPMPYEPRIEDALEALIEAEEDALRALHAVIRPTGQEPRSEAVEHLVEHLILRKQNQVDFLIRARG